MWMTPCGAKFSEKSDWTTAVSRAADSKMAVAPKQTGC